MRFRFLLATWTMHSIAQNISNYRSNGWHSNRSNRSNSLAHRTCMSLHLRHQMLYLQLVIRCSAIRTVHNGRHTISDSSTVRYDWIFGKRKTTAKTRTTMHDGNVFCLILTTWVYMKVFQIWPDAVVLECGCKWTTTICRYSSRVGRNSEKISGNYGYYMQLIAENEENLKIEITELWFMAALWLGMHKSFFFLQWLTLLYND